MKVLGLNLSHNASAAIIKDGEVFFAIENDRLSKNKHDTSILNILFKLKDKFFDYISYTSYNLNKNNRDFYENYVKTNLILNNITYNELIEFPFHHATHAFSAFYNSGFEEAICLIIDNGGVSLETEGIQLGKEILSIIKINKKEYSDVLKICSNDKNFIYNTSNLKSLPTLSPAGLFASAQGVLNYKEPGAIMGRSSYGKDINKFCDIYKFEDNMFFINPLFLHQLMTEEGKDEDNVCYKIQKDATNLVLKYLEIIKLNFPNKKICLSGGFFQNCMTNYEILKNKYDVFVDPVSHDGGTAVGLAQHIYKIKTNKEIYQYKNLYLSLNYTKCKKDYFESVLIKDKKLNLKEVNKEEIAKLLFNNKSIALFQGRAEFGPRALGNRSILFNPCNPFAKEKINLIKKREWFRPYAGTILHENKDEWFEFCGKENTKYMSYAVKIKEEKINIIPGICHVDNTCRVQTLKKEENKNFYELINEFKKLTNVPILLNTSLNIAGKPLVESPDDLIEFIIETNIDYTYLPEINLLLSNNYK